jgi:hypothetical protein
MILTRKFYRKIGTGVDITFISQISFESVL